MTQLNKNEFVNLGFLHEQSRADRDDYVTIKYANIETGRIMRNIWLFIFDLSKLSFRCQKKGFTDQFDKQLTNYDYQGLAYDIMSIMHYGSYAFSANNLETIVAASGQTLLDAYEKTELSSLDVTALRKAYQRTF